MNRMSRVPSPPASRRDAGFTLIELLVSLAVTAVLILGVLATFDFSARMNRVQMHVADMQQSLRVAQNEVVRFSRMAARGRMQADRAVVVTNNVAADTLLVDEKDETEVLEGTDILRVRGVISSTVYQIDTVTTEEVFKWSADGKGHVIVFPTAQGVPQDLAALETALDEYKDKKKEGDGETLLVVDNSGETAVVQVVSAEIEDPPNLRIEFQRHPQEAVLGAMNAGFKRLVSIGILEDYAFYVRVKGGEAPTLARARMEPGSDQPYRGDLEYATQDLADNILDLQAAYGLGIVDEPELRVTTLARTDRADPGRYQAPLLPETIEDHAYPDDHPFNTLAARRYRWRLLRTDINLRNL